MAIILKICPIRNCGDFVAKTWHGLPALCRITNRTVLDNVAFGLEIKGIPLEERYRRATEALKMVKLEAWRDRYPDELSGGMKQRVGLARALVMNTSILLMDEPFSALDALIRTDMEDELLNLQQEIRKTIIFVTHDLDEALHLGDRIAVMRDGRIEQIGTAEEILSNPANEYVLKFLRKVDVSKVLTAGDVARGRRKFCASPKGHVRPN